MRQLRGAYSPAVVHFRASIIISSNLSWIDIVILWCRWRRKALDGTFKAEAARQAAKEAAEQVVAATIAARDADLAAAGAESAGFLHEALEKAVKAKRCRVEASRAALNAQQAWKQARERWARLLAIFRHEFLVSLAKQSSICCSFGIAETDAAKAVIAERHAGRLIGQGPSLSKAVTAEDKQGNSSAEALQSPVQMVGA